MRVEAEEFMGVPVHLVRPYADTLDQLSRSMQQHATTTDPFILYVLGRAQLVLQGRLEGLALAWHYHSGDLEPEDRLREAAMSYARR